MPWDVGAVVSAWPALHERYRYEPLNKYLRGWRCNKNIGARCSAANSLPGGRAAVVVGGRDTRSVIKVAPQHAPRGAEAERLVGNRAIQLLVQGVLQMQPKA